jgi:hypothetical protein
MLFPSFPVPVQTTRRLPILSARAAAGVTAFLGRLNGLPKHLFAELRTDIDPPFQNFAQSSQNLTRSFGLGQVSRSPCPKSTQGVAVFIIHREHQDRQLWQFCFHDLDQFDPSGPGRDMSTMAAFGGHIRIIRKAVGDDDASQQTARSSSALMRSNNPRRISGWSSTINTKLFTGPHILQGGVR